MDRTRIWVRPLELNFKQNMKHINKKLRTQAIPVQANVGFMVGKVALSQAFTELSAENGAYHEIPSLLPKIWTVLHLFVRVSTVVTRLNFELTFSFCYSISFIIHFYVYPLPWRCRMYVPLMRSFPLTKFHGVRNLKNTTFMIWCLQLQTLHNGNPLVCTRKF
jgi:hypothetical protein